MDLDSIFASFVDYKSLRKSKSEMKVGSRRSLCSWPRKTRVFIRALSVAWITKQGIACSANMFASVTIPHASRADRTAAFLRIKVQHVAIASSM